jgi:hypothetical protein
MKIDCDTCTVRGEACADCVVSFLTIPVRDGLRAVDAEARPVEIDRAQERAIRALSDAGLVAPLRHLA